MWRESRRAGREHDGDGPVPRATRAKYFSMPVRNVVPKPVQKPHPPMWVACSNRDTIHLAAQLGLGALTFAFIDPAEARHWVTDYYETFKRECVPIGHAVNPNIAMVTSFSCHPDEQEALRRGTDGFRFFQFALGHFYAFGKHKPGRTNIWERYTAVRDELGARGPRRRRGRHRHAEAAPRAPPQVRRRRRRPVGLHPAGRQQPAREHLRGPRAVRARGHAGVQGRGGRAPPTEGRGAGAVHRGGDAAQGAHDRDARRRDSRRTRPTATTSPKSTCRSCPNRSSAACSRCARCARSSAASTSAKPRRPRPRARGSPAAPPTAPTTAAA